jgi:deoxycytidylate deaminase
MNKATRRFLGAALSESAASTYGRVKIGSVIVVNGREVARGANLSTSHPLQKQWNDWSGRLAPVHALHSEMHALVRARRKGVGLSGAIIYIGRMDRNGKLADCRPCIACHAALRAYGIQEMIYTTPEGVKREPIQ